MTDNNIFTPAENMTKVIDLLRHVNGFMRLNDLPYWVISATLLGAVRNGRMLPWYDDADISIPEHILPYLLHLIENDEMICIREMEDRYRLFWRAQESERYPYPFVDIFPCEMRNDEIVYTNARARESLSKEWFHRLEMFPLVEWSFEDFSVWGPCQPHRYLDVNFPKWRTHGRTNGYINATRTRVPVVEFSL